MKKKQINKIQYRLAKVQDFESGRMTYWYKSPLCKSHQARSLYGLQDFYELLDHYRDEGERIERAQELKKIQFENITRMIKHTDSIWVENQQ